MTKRRDGAPDEGLRKLQQQAVDEGFLMPVDGVDGPQTREMFAKYREWKKDKAATEAAATEAKAKAEQQRANAAAEKAKAEAEAIRARAEADRIAADAKKRADEAVERDKERVEQERQQAIKTGLTVAFPLAGIYAGHKVAKNITAQDAASISQRAKNINALAKDIDATVAKYSTARGAAKTMLGKQLVGSVRTADRLQLTRTKGPRAGVIAAMLVAEGAFSRFVAAPNVTNETAKEALLQASSASLFAATTLVGERSVAIATPQAAPKASALASVEKARALTEGKTVASAVKDRAMNALTPPKPQKGGAAGGSKLLGRLALGVGVVTAVAAIVQSARAGGLKEAAKTTASLLDPTGLVDRALANEGPTIRDLARDQAAARNGGMLTAVPGGVSDQASANVQAGVTPAGQAEFVRRVAGSGLDNFYRSPQPAEIERRADALGLAGAAAREANSRAEPRPQMQAVPTPASLDPTAPVKPRHVWDDYARERAAEARRNKGL